MDSIMSRLPPHLTSICQTQSTPWWFCC